MGTESTSLDSKYNILSINVISSNAITTRTSQVTRHLNIGNNDAKAGIVTLRAKASVANKLISIVEIAKRELSQNGKKIYQYSTLTSAMVELKPAKKPAVDTDHQDTNFSGGDGISDEEEEAFQTMDEKAKIRNMPVLTIHLSFEPIKELREIHGYVFETRAKNMTDCDFTESKQDDTLGPHLRTYINAHLERRLRRTKFGRFGCARWR